MWRQEIADAVAATVAKFGGIDAVFSNAGTSGTGWIHDTSVADFEAIIRINLVGGFIVAKHTLPEMMDRGGGAFVSTGSIASLVVGAGGSAVSYAASKGGINMLTKQIAVDYCDYGIRANTLCPGGVMTGLGRNAAEDRARAVRFPVHFCGFHPKTCTIYPFFLEFHKEAMGK